MSIRSLRSMLVLTAALAAACAEAPTSLSPGAPALGKTSSGSTDTDPRARWEFLATLQNGTTATRLYGDGRNVDGTAVSADGLTGAYQGNHCGVHAKIFVGNGGGDAVIDPDKNHPSQNCGAARVLRYDLGNGTVVSSGSFTNARGVYHLTSLGATRDQDMFHSSTNIPNCESFRFEVGLGSGVRVTRISEGTAAGQWRVETLGDHVGRCYNYVKGKYVHRPGTDPAYVMPYHAVVTEVR